jgi:hypothetical protein
MTEASNASQRPNLVLWISIGVPLATIVASAITLYFAYVSPEPELPAEYSWEGSALDADFARAEAARRLGVSVALDFSADGLVQAQLGFAAGAHPWPASLELKLTHSTLPTLDRTVRLTLDSGSGHYTARLAPLPRGHWLAQVEPGPEWRLRKKFSAPVHSVSLGL